MPELAEEPLCVAEDAKHHRAVDSNAGQREGHAFEEAGHLHGKGAGVTGAAWHSCSYLSGSQNHGKFLLPVLLALCICLPTLSPRNDELAFM